MMVVGNASLRGGFLRGGNWDFGTTAGAFTLALDDAPASANTSVGFRVAR